MAGEFTAVATNFITSLDYAALAADFNTAIFDFFTALFKNIDYGQIGQLAMNPILGMFGSLTGCIIGTAEVAKFITFIGFLGTVPSGVVVTIAGWLGIVGPIITGIGTFLTGTLLPAFSALATFVMGTVVSAIVVVAAPVLAVVGAVLFVSAVVRNFGNIVIIVGAGQKWLWSNIEKGWLTLLSGLLKAVKVLLDKVGLGGFIKGAVVTVDAELAKATQDSADAAIDISDAANGIACLIAEDFGKIRDAAGNLVPKFGETNEAVVATAELMQGLNEEVKKVGSTYANNRQVVYSAGQSWGWVMKDGEKVMVEWGSVAGTAQAAFFNSQRDAVSWEKRVAPSNEMVKSVTTHTGEVCRGNVNVGGINITVYTESSMDGDEIANMVAGKVMTAVQDVMHGELFLT